MSLDMLRARLVQGIKSSEKTESSRYQHMSTALNNLLKKGVVEEDHLALALGDELEKTLTNYKSILESEGKSDVRAPLTRVRRLSEFYKTVFELDTESMSFAELMQAAVARKYGASLWTGPVTPKNQAEVLSKHITYRHVAKEIVVTACIENPELWNKVDLAMPPTLGSASKVVRDYIAGNSIPSERVPDSRIHYIEKFLHLPKFSLLTKIRRRIDHNNRGKKQSEKSPSHTQRKKPREKFLGQRLQKVFDEYSAYKMNGEQPDILNISPELRGSRHFELRAKVQEHNRRNSNWTINSKGICGSQSAFLAELLAFQSYCISIGLSIDEIGTRHLTDPNLIQRMLEQAGKEGKASWAARIFNWIYRGTQNQGYLRFCADLSERSLSELFDDLDYIRDEYPTWIEIVSKGIYSRGGGAYKGKENILFLLRMTPSVRRNLVHRVSQWLLDRALNYQQEAHQQIKFARAAPGPIGADKRYRAAASNIRRALNYIQAAMVQEVSFYNAPRATNWSMLKYYENASVQDRSYASLTFLRQRNRYHLFIPLYGSSLVDPSARRVRYIKNADSKNAVDIDLELPERLTGLIKKLLSIRTDYIEMDLVRYAGVDASSVEPLLPWRSTRANSVTDKNKLLTRKSFFPDSGKLGETFLSMTYTGYLNIAPDEKQHGINIHAIRHLVAETHLDEHPGDFIGAASKLNDDVEQIIKTYGDKDRAKAMRRVSQEGENEYLFD